MRSSEIINDQILVNQGQLLEMYLKNEYLHAFQYYIPEHHRSCHFDLIPLKVTGGQKSSNRGQHLDMHLGTQFFHAFQIKHIKG